MLFRSARWGVDLPQAVADGKLLIANREISCSVLADGRRMLTQSDFLTALGRSTQPKAGTGIMSLDELPAFLSADNLKPFITNELRDSTKPVAYLSTSGRKTLGYEAKLLPLVCDVYLKARDHKVLQHMQNNIVKMCDLLMRGLAHVGIIALVDEATGYQYDRARDALAQILETFIDNELKKWIKTFPDDFYKQIARLKGYQLRDINKRGQVYATLTNYLIYKRLAPGVLKELKRITPKDSKGRRKHKYFQRLTEDIGHPALRELLSNQIVLMKLFPDGGWAEFDKAMNRVLPPYGDHPLFNDLDEKATLTTA